MHSLAGYTPSPEHDSEFGKPQIFRWKTINGVNYGKNYQFTLKYMFHHIYPCSFELFEENILVIFLPL